MTTKETIGRNVAARRAEQNLTQKKLADHSGVTRATVANIEQGIRFPSITVFFAIAKALKISPVKLFY